MGKLRISLRQQAGSIKPVFAPKTVAFHGDASYLLVGGLGGLGYGLTRWMVEHNARHLIFLSRSAGDTDSDKMLFRELESQGCSVTAVKGSVCRISDVERAISSATAPLRGIFNIAMVLRDESFDNMSLEQWNAATEPKVQGTWNLHRASLEHNLDFFVLFSSMCGMVGMPGQLNYSSANSFMDAFVQYRHRAQLPASVLDLGAVEGIGHVAENPHVLSRSQWLETVRMSQKELFEALTVAISNGLPLQEHGTGVGYMNPAQLVVAFRPTARMPDGLNGTEYFFDSRLSTFRGRVSEASRSDDPASVDELAQFVSSAATSQDVLSRRSAGAFVAVQIAKWVFELLLKPVNDESEIDIMRSLSDVGLDSLAAVELRSWWGSTFGSEISVLEINSFPSFAALGEHAVQGLREKFWPAETGSRPKDCLTAEG